MGTPNADDSNETAPTFLSGGGELGARIRAYPWATTPMGPPALWPQSLKLAIRVMLASMQPFWIGWGPELIYFYNDPYKSIIGGKHPWALGRPTAEVWREIWTDIAPLLDTAMKGDQGTYVESQLLIMHRHGYEEETYYTFSYSPIPNDDGSVGGIICANSDDTRRVIGERQLALLAELAAGTANARSWREACITSAQALETDPHDLPFALIYIAEAESDTLSLAGTSGIVPGHPAAPEMVSTRSEIWPFDEVLRKHDIKIVSDLDSRIAGGVPAGPWARAPKNVAIIPILPTGETGRSGVLVAGLNPYRLPDEDYQAFLGLVAGQIASAIANAQAYDEERRRAESLAELDRAKTTFFSNVSHEFRTPLTLMLGPLEDALNSVSAPLAENQRERIQTAHRNGLRLLKLVNSLLDFSRIEAGRIEANYEPTDIAGLTANLAANFESAIERAGLRFIIKCPHLGEVVWLDHDMWEKIVLNLLSNAFKFTLDGEISIEMRRHDQFVELVVADTGVGIPAHELPRLFERFHRVEGQESRSFEGSGIGLALVQELVRLQGGKIEVESEVGKGTKFVVRLPMGHSHLPQDRLGGSRRRGSTSVRADAFVAEAMRWLPGAGEPPSVLSAREEAEASLPSKAPDAHVLVVDDSADMRDYIKKLLAKRWSVETASDGHAALEQIRTNKPDLLLTDVMMPGLDGFGLLREIRKHPEFSDMPVIVLSARAGEEARVEGLDAGADDYLTKPFSARELVARVNTNLELARLRREATHELRKAKEELEKRVQEEIAERMDAEAQLRQAQKMEAVGKLTGGVAHDFNNVLQVIGGNLQLLMKDVANNTRAEQRLQTALAGVSRGSRLASQLLAFGRRQPLAPKVVNLGRLVRSIDDMLRRALGEAIELETIASGGLWNTFVDTAHVENALLNLVINARDAMGISGKLTIELGNAFLDEYYCARNAEVTPGQYVMLAVSDTGSGMSPDVMDRVFEPFFTTKPEGQGTGLGLSMVYGFVKQSGGHVKIYSEVGQGTTIRLYLPRAVQQEDVEAEIEPGAATGGSESILVVEDDEDVRETVVSMMSELGYNVLKAKDADNALAILESGVHIDLLFTDVIMPGKLRSPELARKARERIPGIRVLFTSGYTENAIVHGGRLDEGVDLLSKPYSREKLARKLRHALQNKAQLEIAGTRTLDSKSSLKGKPLRVLLVEDEVLIRMSTAEMLADLGHTVIEAGNAEEALTLVGEQDVDLLLTDIGLPQVSGTELAQEIRKSRPDIVVVFASGYGRPAEEGGMEGAVVLPKPFSDRELAAALAQAVNSRP
ncbi:MAG TPA: response regulator [Rhizomicrobium sp.]|jgi:signal transduction histidine kinase